MVSHSPLNISETVRDRGLVPNSKGPLPAIGNGLLGIKWSRDRQYHVTRRSRRDPNTLRVQYRENSWRYYLATNNR